MRSDFSIVVDNKEVYFKSSSGEDIYPILYKGSTYLPVRSIGEIMGKNVNWDEKNKTINISGVREASVSYNSKNKNNGAENILIQERSDFTILIDGNKKEFHSVLGQKIYPILYNGSTYLPIRAIGEIMDKEVLWDAENNTVTLKSKNSLTVTDADSFNSTNNKQGNLSLEDAKKIALEYAKVKEKDAVFKKTKKDYENGKEVYDIEFYVGRDEYEIEIDINTGEIVKYDFDIESSNSKNDTQSNLSLEDAKKIALEYAKVKEKDAVFKKTKKDYENGKEVYDIEFYVGRDEYEIEIDINTGEIVKYDFDIESSNSKNDTQSNLSLEDAKKIALEYAKVKEKDAVFKKTKKDYEDGKEIYDIEFYVGRNEYEIEIDANTGEIIEYDLDYDD